MEGLFRVCGGAAVHGDVAVGGNLIGKALTLLAGDVIEFLGLKVAGGRKNGEDLTGCCKLVQTGKVQLTLVAAQSLKISSADGVAMGIKIGNVPHSVLLSCQNAFSM